MSQLLPGESCLAPDQGQTWSLRRLAVALPQLFGGFHTLAILRELRCV